MSQVKICGITRLEDAEDAFSLGADYLGLIFAPSPRRIDRTAASEIMDAVVTFGQFVGVFQDEDREMVRACADELGLEYVQLHGQETPDYCHHLTENGLKVIKAFRVNERVTEQMLEPYDVFAFLFDTYVEGKSGGSGKTFDWSLIESNIWHKFRVFVSGGLTPENVDQAIDATHPFGVDVSSGVEKQAGVKDYAKVAEFIRHAKRLLK